MNASHSPKSYKIGAEGEVLMQEQGKDILSSFLTEEQIKAVAQLKDTLKSEEVAELRTAGERLLKNVKTKDDLIEPIESAAQSGLRLTSSPPD